MLTRDRERLHTTFELADDALGRLIRQVRGLDPGAADSLSAVREMLDHAACLQRVGHHDGCDCPKRLARLELDRAIADVVLCTALAHRQEVVGRQEAREPVAGVGGQVVEAAPQVALAVQLAAA